MSFYSVIDKDINQFHSLVKMQSDNTEKQRRKGKAIADFIKTRNSRFLIKIKCSIPVIKNLKKILDYIEDYKKILSLHPNITRYQFTQSTGAISRQSVLHDITLKKSSLLNTIQELESEILIKRPFDYFEIIGKPMSFESDDETFIINHSRNIKMLHNYIDSCNTKKLIDKQKCIEIVARIYYSAGCIDTTFKDMCYCVKDNEQYVRYITKLKKTKNYLKLNKYIVKMTNKILQSEEFYFKYLP